MEMILTGIENKNEYYTNHYFTSIFQDNAEDTIKKWKQKEKEEEIQLPWKKLRDIRTQYYNIRDRYLRSKNEEVSKPLVQELAALYLEALGYGAVNSVIEEVADGVNVPIFHEVTKANGAPLLWAFLSVAAERDDDILNGYIFEKSDDEEENGASVDVVNDEILAKLFFAGEEAPRFILLIGINQIALIDRNKWNEKRYLQFMMEDIYSRHEESTFMAMTVLLHKESLCPSDGNIVLDGLDENSHKHSAGVSDALKYALRESIEILGNEVIYDMKTRQGIDLEENPIDAAELTLECLRYMYRFLFMLFIEARPELGYAPMKSQTYVQGYSLEGLRDVCDQVKEDSEALAEGYYIDDTLKKLFHMTYFGYPEDLEAYKKAIKIEKTSMHDAFTIEALKAHIFDPDYTKLITKARLRNSAMLQIVDLMSISRPGNAKERKGRISYSALGINQMGAVYEALLSYRGFIAEEDLYEVKRAGDKFNELDVGYFVKENELVNYDEKTERVRYESGEKKGQLRMYEKGTFIYRLAGREREKSASYYTPEVLTKCLVKYALKELLKDKTADEILHLTVCEPAMGSAAFLNEAINQLAEAYLTKKQEELGETISYDKRFEELQKVKMYIADRNVYGCDLNPVAVELAEVSLWLNTIYKGAYVPWFGTQLVNGNSLVGARRQVYSQSALEAGKWYDKAPRRIMPGEERTKKGQHEHTKEIYHFLLGDPGMANYTDKVIKSLEPENIKKLKAWNKEFTSKFDEDELKTVLRLSESIDRLWKLTADERKRIEEATEEPLSVYGHVEVGEGSHKSIREKDAIYKKIFKSEEAQNAGPYARLKAAMDYWCALWFWPIDKVDLLPSRQEFFFDMSLILEGNIRAVNVNSSGQMVFRFEEDGSGLSYVTEGDQLALEFKAQYSDLGEVCLDDLRERSERLAIANQIAGEQRFHHWELEFSDIFRENGGFDLVIGNPPWLKMGWNEMDIMSDIQPIFSVKKLSVSATRTHRDAFLDSVIRKRYYEKSYIDVCALQNFLSATTNYAENEGMIPNLFKCFLPMAWKISNNTGAFAFVHPESVFDDPHGARLRELLYPKLKQHFQFINEKMLFAEIGHPNIYSLNIYSNVESDGFDVINNLFVPETIDACYAGNDEDNLPGIKDENNEWNINGHKDRILNIGSEELLIFSKFFDGDEKYKTARLPSLHVKQFLDVIRIVNDYPTKYSDKTNTTCLSYMWHETYAQDDGTIVRQTVFPSQPYEMILSGPHIGVANPLYKTPRRICVEKADYDCIDLENIEEDYRARSNYIVGCDKDKYYSLVSKTPWGDLFFDDYRIAARRMVNLKQERSLISAIVPPFYGQIHGVCGIRFKNIEELVMFQGGCCSLVFDFLIKIMGKVNLVVDNVGNLPLLNYDSRIMCRTLLLNCLTADFADLWKRCYSEKFKCDLWLREDELLDNILFQKLGGNWSIDIPVKNAYQRRELMLEIDVLVAKALGLSLEQLIAIYNIQFSVLKSYEGDTWYDQRGQIVFTNNRSLIGVGLDRKEWETIQNMKTGEYVKNVEDDSTEKGVIELKKRYKAPFFKCDREKDYREIWSKV